jgi:IclR family acetate operon transcriptional repressor
MNSSSRVPLLETAIRILEHLAECEGPITSSGLARELDASQPTCYRILKTLEAADWIRPNTAGGYDLSMGVFPLAKRFIDLDASRRVIQPVLDRLTAAVELTVKFSVRMGREQATLAAAATTRPYGVAVTVGARHPVVQGASGAVLLASLSAAELKKVIAASTAEDWEHETPELLRRRIAAIRKHGVCENLGLNPRGFEALGVPVRTARGPAAITLLGLRGDIGRHNLKFLKDRLKAAAADAERELT